MANPERGEVGFDHAGKSYTLRLTTGAQIAIEDELDLGFGDVVKRMVDENRTKDAIIVFHAMLRDSSAKQPEFADVCDMVDEMGGEAVGELIGRAFLQSKSVTLEAEAGTSAKGKPRKTVKSTGRSSRKSGRKPAGR